MAEEGGFRGACRAQHPDDVGIIAHDLAHQRPADAAPAVLRRHGHHRDVAVGDVVAQRPGEADHLAFLHGHGHALGIGDQLREAFRIADLLLPTVGGQQTPGRLDLCGQRVTDFHRRLLLPDTMSRAVPPTKVGSAAAFAPRSCDVRREWRQSVAKRMWMRQTMHGAMRTSVRIPTQRDRMPPRRDAARYDGCHERLDLLFRPSGRSVGRVL
ncbi:hypothetical protein D3C72_1409130 [compost metagenome]